MSVEFSTIPTLGIVKAHLAINCVLVFLTLVVLAARLWARYRSGAKLWWDDYLIIAAVPQGIGMLIIQGLYSRLGIGYDISVTLVNIPLILRLLVAYELIYAVCISTIKLSMMLFYLRVFVNGGLRLAVKLTMGFVGAWTFGNILQVFLICRPFRSTFDPTVPGVCGNQVASFIAIGAFNVVTDILILGLPMRTVWGLKMRTPAKIGITLIFMVGLLVSVVAIIRIVALTKLDLTNLTLTMIDADFWSTFEPNIAIFCVCLPMLGPLWSGCTTRTKTTKASIGPSSGSNPRSSKQFNRLGENYDMERLYASNKDVHYEADATKHEGKEYGESPNGSEAGLSPEPKQQPSNTAIQVSTKWTVSSSNAA